MYLYDEEHKKTNFNPSNYLLIGKGQYGEVYQISEVKCLKVFTSVLDNDDFEEVFTIIRKLNLKNFYQLYQLYTNLKGNKIKAYLAKYYQSEEIDILTMPIEYTLDNLYGLYEDIMELTERNIFVSDLHDENVILNSQGITAIDIDLYTKNKYWTSEKLTSKNINAINYLFVRLYMEAIANFHEGSLPFDNASLRICQFLFLMNESCGPDNVCDKLSRYKYPIDYFKKMRTR